MAATSSNPFATRFVQPGALPWIPPDQSATIPRLVALFCNDMSRRAAIIGKHGSGKSTLLAHLLSQMPDLDFARVQLRRPDGPLRRSWAGFRQLSAGGVLVLDGWEQLPSPGRILFRLATRLHNVGLLVTSHTPCGLPVLYHAAASPQLAWQLVQQRILASGNQLSQEQWRDFERFTYAAYHQHGGNLREVFMELYDTFAALRGWANHACAC